ncbi:MAG TPA: hypothetical protein VNN18_12360 [Candidatus Xenobia bacterium]|nr:hypothetical protein [Candidatus Xenobia bacterium]
MNPDPMQTATADALRRIARILEYKEYVMVAVAIEVVHVKVNVVRAVGEFFPVGIDPLATHNRPGKRVFPVMRVPGEQVGRQFGVLFLPGLFVGGEKPLGVRERQDRRAAVSSWTPAGRGLHGSSPRNRLGL